jgi:carbon-monoxide dehydrogenase medium subunit
VKPNRFSYHAPSTVDEAVALLAEYGEDGKVLAGGQSLLPLMNFRMAAPEHLVDINRLPDLDRPRRTATGWHFPALVRQRTVERSAEVARDLPLLTTALTHVAHPQIRNRGTICGSLAHADPAAELPAVMTALGARMHVRSARGEREVPAAEFFLFHLTSALEPDELLTGVSVDDLAAGTGTAFREFATRRGDFALAAVAAVVVRDDTGTVTGCRLVAAGVGATPVRLSGAERAATGGRLEPAALAAVEDAARRETDPLGDLHAGAGQRRRLVGVLARRALDDLVDQVDLREDAA